MLPTPPRPAGPALALAAAFAAALGLGSACQEWPRYQHLPPGGDTGALPAGADPTEALEVDWGQAQDHVETGSASGLPVTVGGPLQPGQGLFLRGQLDGAGWVADGDADRTGACGTLAFPLADEGTYAGDVDWLGAEAGAAGWLCATVEFDSAELSYDLVPFVLDACDEPGQALVDELSRPWGMDQQGVTATWAAPVQAGDRIGVALAAFWPQDPTLVTGWSAGLFLSSSGLCPSLPGMP
ncbi:hypothetical protein L6R53_15455 [Myxococcota bacterium]|nr:hypothetical protein [Myxococcota bacterium]